MLLMLLGGCVHAQRERRLLDAGPVAVREERPDQGGRELAVEMVDELALGLLDALKYLAPPL